VVTNSVTIIVYALFTPGTIGESQTIAYNTSPDPLTGVTPSGGTGNNAYQWQESSDNQLFLNITGATNLTYSSPPLTDTTHFRLLQIDLNGCGSGVTNAITITVQPMPVISVTVPNAGEMWTQGTEYDIQWEDNITGNIKIELWRSGQLVMEISSSYPSNGHYLWTVPSDQKAGSDYQVRVTSLDDIQLFDESDSTFSITTVVPLNRLIQDMHIYNGDVYCYDALQTITTAGAGTEFHVLGGASATLIAGVNILMMPGTIVDSGSYLLAMIAPEGPFCQVPSMVAQTTGMNEYGNPVTEHPQTIVYPNPTEGEFRIRWHNRSAIQTIEVIILDSYGKILKQWSAENLSNHIYSLVDRPVGIYFVKIISGDEVVTRKLIKQ
jgi:hypothetical protein